METKTAAARVLHTVELLEAILLHLPQRDILRCQFVSRFFAGTITISKGLQEAMLLRQIPSPPSSNAIQRQFSMNPLLFALRIPHQVTIHTIRPWHQIASLLPMDLSDLLQLSIINVNDHDTVRFAVHLSVDSLARMELLENRLLRDESWAKMYLSDVEMPFQLVVSYIAVTEGFWKRREWYGRKKGGWHKVYTRWSVWTILRSCTMGDVVRMACRLARLDPDIAEESRKRTLALPRRLVKSQGEEREESGVDLGLIMRDPEWVSEDGEN